MPDQKGRIFVSDCGKYIAIQSPDMPGGHYDVVALDGSGVWVSIVRRAEHTHNIHPRIVTGCSNYGRTNRAGRYVPDFELSFADVDMGTPIRAFTGNTIRQSYAARFSRPFRPSTKPKRAS